MTLSELCKINPDGNPMYRTSMGKNNYYVGYPLRYLIYSNRYDFNQMHVPELYFEDLTADDWELVT